MNNSLTEYTNQQRARWGEKYNPGALDARFLPYFRTGERIKVETCGEIVTGTVSASTGWAPVLLLMRTRRSIGSMWTLGPRDTLLAVKRGRGWVAVPNGAPTA